MDKLSNAISAVTAWIADHKKATLVIACLVAGAVWGIWARGLFAAPLTCDLTGQALNCNIPTSGTPVPNPGPVTPPVTPPPGEFASCPAGTVKLTNGFPLNATNVVQGGNGSVLTIKLAIPAAATAGNHSAYFSSTYGGSAARTFVVSASPCDFNTPVVDSTGKKPKALSAQTSSNAFTFGFPVGDDDKGLKRGQTYYLNVRIDGGCSGSCSFDAIRIN